MWDALQGAPKPDRMPARWANLGYGAPRRPEWTADELAAIERFKRQLKARRRCSGLTARWCPVHGDCTCIREGHLDLDDPLCALHGEQSNHAET